MVCPHITVPVPEDTEIEVLGMLETTPQDGLSVEGAAPAVTLQARRNPLRVALMVVARFCGEKLQDSDSGPVRCCDGLIHFDSVNLDRAIDEAANLLGQIDLNHRAGQLREKWNVVCDWEVEIEGLSFLQLGVEQQLSSWRGCVQELRDFALEWAESEQVARDGAGLANPIRREYGREEVPGDEETAGDGGQPNDNQSAEESRAPVWDAQTEARNKWLYEECCNVTIYKTIIAELEKRTDWEQITSPGGIKRAANAYATRKGLSSIPPRQGGRPKK